MISQAPFEKDGGKTLELLHDAIESLSEGFALYDNEFALVMFNQRYREMNALVEDLLEPGLKYEFMLKEMVRRGGYSDAIGSEDAWVAQRLENAMDFKKNDEINHSNGKSYQVSIHPTKLGGFVVTRSDITERKQAEAKERDVDLMIRTVLDASSAVVVMARTGDGEVLYRSPAAQDLFGDTKFAREHYLSAEDRADFVTQMLSDGLVDDYRRDLVAKGAIFPSSMSSRFAEYKGEEVLVTSIVDLTQQIKAQALIRQVLEACPVPIQMTKVKSGELLFASPETTELFGSTQNARSYYVDEIERKKYIEKLRLDGSVYDYKSRLINADQESFWGAVSARLIEFQGDEVIVSNTRDMTKELDIQEELATQREIIFQNEKMSALGELLAGVAHELNNPLSIVVGHALMLQEEVEDENVLQRVQKIGKAAERSAKIIKSFLAMARQKPAKTEPVSAESLFATAVDVVKFGYSNEDIQILSNCPVGLPDIMADADQIIQVVINLLLNACHAISNSGSGSQIELHAFADPQGTVVNITISDNGPGVPETHQARIFEPFFTTKEVGDGTGIGLAFCHRIIHSHGGNIWLDTNYLHGAKFCISLPVATPGGTTTDNNSAFNKAPQFKSVLVVDDENDVAEFVAEVLRKDGFRVDIANSGKQALERIETSNYDVILSDLNMKKIDGRGLYDALKRYHPKLLQCLAFITGDIMGKTSQKTLLETQRPCLEKPASPDEIRGLVANLLNDVKEQNDG